MCFCLICALLLHFSEKGLFIFSPREDINKKDSFWKWLTELYTVLLGIECSNNNVAGVSAGKWGAIWPWRQLELWFLDATAIIQSGVSKDVPCAARTAWLWAEALREMGLSVETWMGQLTSNHENVGGCLFLNKHGVTTNFLKSA